LTEKLSRASARRNALLVAAVLAVLAAWNVHRHRPLLAGMLGGLSLALCLVALISPSWTARFNRGWVAFAAALGYVNSRVLLSLMYYLVVTPFGVVLRLAGHDPLHRRGPQRESYWVPREIPRQSRSGFERPF
jgi:hypothetical protein